MLDMRKMVMSERISPNLVHFLNLDQGWSRQFRFGLVAQNSLYRLQLKLNQCCLLMVQIRFTVSDTALSLLSHQLCPSTAHNMQM